MVFIILLHAHFLLATFISARQIVRCCCRICSRFCHWKYIFNAHIPSDKCPSPCIHSIVHWIFIDLANHIHSSSCIFRIHILHHPAIPALSCQRHHQHIRPLSFPSTPIINASSPRGAFHFYFFHHLARRKKDFALNSDGGAGQRNGH